MRFYLILFALALVPSCSDDTSEHDVTDAADDGRDGSEALDDGSVEAEADGEVPDGDAAACDGGCEPPLLCCDDRCVHPSHDPAHCGGCGLPCSGDTPFCDNGSCAVQPCTGPALCGMRPCCGESCCEPGQVCCVVEGGALGPPTCHDDVCPAGCPWCP